MGCCTACAVRVKSGEMSQPEALGVAAELRERGFALMCVGSARSDLVLELAEEDEVYDLQFGDDFGKRATDPSNAESIEKDPFALLGLLDDTALDAAGLAAGLAGVVLAWFAVQ